MMYERIVVLYGEDTWGLKEREKKSRCDGNEMLKEYVCQVR